MSQHFITPPASFPLRHPASAVFGLPPLFLDIFFLMRIGYGEAESCAGASPTALGERRGRQLPGAAGTSLQEKAGKNWQGVESSGKQIRKPAPIYRPAARNCPGGGATAVTLPAPSTSPKRAPLVPRWGWGKQGKQGKPTQCWGWRLHFMGVLQGKTMMAEGCVSPGTEVGHRAAPGKDRPSVLLQGGQSKPKMFPLRKRQ